MPSVPSGDIISGEWTAAFTSSFNFSSIGLGVPPGASRARQATVFGQDGSPTSAIGLMSGALWTGADLFMGFVLGPTPRMLDMRARTALIACLVPRTLLYFPTVSLTAGTTGWFLADWFGFTTSASPMYYLVVISLAMVAVMTVMGLGFLLPNSVRIWRELRRPEPDRERIVHLNRINIWLAGMQGLMQIAIILVMAKYVS